VVKIALCDDNVIFLEELKSLVQNHLINHYVEGEIYLYSDGKDFLKSFEKDKYFFDMVFLDIDMPQTDGIEVAEKIRCSNKNLILVFLTSIENRVYEAFQFNTFRFIRKKCVLNELEECLDKAFRLFKSESTLYSFRTKEGVIKLSTQDILYFTFINRHVELWAQHNHYIISVVRFQDIIDQFIDKNFVCIHRGCMVNVKYIKAINKLYIILDNNQKLSISRYKVNEVFEAFTNYAK
jgi:DNA-binding LytR/AlgR family response regulator